MATINVLLTARAKDKGVKKFFRDATKLADKFTASADRAAAAGRKLEGINVGGMATGGGGGSRGRTPRARGGGAGRDPVAASLKRIAKAKEKAAKRGIREAQQVVKAQVTAGRRQTRVLNQQLKERQRQGRQIKNLSREQLVQLEVEQEITKRRRRAARTEAKGRLGPEGGGGRRGKGLPGRGRLDVGANLAIAGAEFEQFGAQVEGGIRTSFDAFKDYEKGVIEVSTLTDKIPVDQIRKITQEAAAEFGGLPTDQVAAFYAIVSAGATDATEAQSQLTAANKLAIGGVATQEEAVLAISKSVANFGSQLVETARAQADAAGVGFNEDEFDSSARAADILFASVQKGQNTVSELARAIPATANAAATLGLSMEETAAAVSFLSTKMPSASEAANGLKQAISNIQKPSRAAREEAKRLGIDFSKAGIDAAGGIEAWVTKLRASEKFSETSLAKLFKSSQARDAIGGIANDLEGFNKVLLSTTSMAPVAEGAFAKMSDTAAQKAKKLEAQTELLKIQVGEALVPAMTELFETAEPVVKGFRDWIKENPRLAGTLGKVAIAVAVGAKGIGLLTSAMSMASTISGVMAQSFGRAGVAATAAGTGAAGAATKVSKLSQVGSGLKTGMAVATVAVIAFELALANAQGATDAEIDRLDKLNRASGEGGLAVAFQTDEGKEKTENELLLERRQRLVEDVQAKREQFNRGRGHGAGAQIGRGSVLSGLQSGAAGVFNAATGVSAEQERQFDQSKLDLARFDRERGDQLGFTEDSRFTTAGGGDGAGLSGRLADLMQASLDVQKMTAANTATQPWQGPSLDAGLT